MVQIQVSTASFVGDGWLETTSNELPGRNVYDADGAAIDVVLPANSNLQPLTGFLAVLAACFTSGLAGVYFEMVLKGWFRCIGICKPKKEKSQSFPPGSTADLWIRNVQLSSWSIIPALIPVLVGFLRDGTRFGDIFVNFGFWAWCTVLMQVLGGLVTALVIKVCLSWDL